MPTKQTRWKRRRRLLLWMAFGVSIPFVWILSVLFGDPDPIRISRETTYITEAVHPAGYVDLTDEVNRLLREGAPDDRLLDTTSLRKIFTELPFTQRGSWNDAGGLSHDRYRDAVADAVRMSMGNKQLPPLPDGDQATWSGLRQPAYEFVEQPNQWVNQAARSIQRRLRERIDASERTGTLADLSCLADIQRFYARQRSVIYTAFCSSDQTQAAELLAKCLSTKLLTPEECEAVLTRVPEVGLDDIERLVRLHRLHAMDQISRYHSGANPVLGDFLFTVSGANFQQRTYVDFGSRWIRGRVDWESVSTRVNRAFDEIDRHLLSLTDAERNNRLDEIAGLPGWREAGFRLLRSSMTMSAQETTDWVTACILQYNTHAVQHVERLTAGTHYINLLRLALSVKKHRRQHGALPESLIDIEGCNNQLATLRPGFAPECLYNRTASGFELRDVRDNSVLLRWDTDGEIVIPGVTDDSK